MVELEAGTEAQQRLADRLLGWGQPRPPASRALADRIQVALEDQLAAVPDLQAAAALQRRGRVLITKTRLDRIVCDGLAIDAEPFTHTWASMRGILTHAVIERDWRSLRSSTAHEVVDDVWHDEASRRPGDPASPSAWMNAQSAEDVATLKAELAELLESFRNIWPVLPEPAVSVHLERAYETTHADGAVALFGKPDIVLASRATDDRARTLVVDLKTGRPRPDHDRHELRFYALLVAMATGSVPFRWATYYVTEGRYDVEDLREESLLATVRRVADGVRQQIRIADAPSGTIEGLRITGGAWCSFCQRQSDCEEGARARAQWMSQAGDMMDS